MKPQERHPSDGEEGGGKGGLKQKKTTSQRRKKKKKKKKRRESVCSVSFCPPQKWSSNCRCTVCTYPAFDWQPISPICLLLLEVTPSRASRRYIFGTGSVARWEWDSVGGTLMLCHWHFPAPYYHRQRALLLSFLSPFCPPSSPPPPPPLPPSSEMVPLEQHTSGT